MTELFNVLLRRSNLVLRVGAEEQATKTLQQKVTDLEQWREQLEDRLKTRNTEVDAKFLLHENRHNQLQHSTEYKFEEIDMFKKLTNDRYSEVKGILERNAEDRNTLHERCDKIAENTEEKL